MACFGTRYGPFRIPIWCILQCVKIPLKHKSLLFSCLRKVLITRRFAPEGESVRKYSLIFRGISGNSGAKTEIRLRFESCPYRFLSERREWRLSVINTRSLSAFISSRTFAVPLVVLCPAMYSGQHPAVPLSDEVVMVSPQAVFSPSSHCLSSPNNDIAMPRSSPRSSASPRKRPMHE